jgi:hypothetical protein
MSKDAAIAKTATPPITEPAMIALLSTFDWDLLMDGGGVAALSGALRWATPMLFVWDEEDGSLLWAIEYTLFFFCVKVLRVTR